jgi:hypothetical protein
MIEIAALIFVAALAGGSATWLFIFSIGEPGKETEYEEGFNPTRIFSRYGAWILDGYTRHTEETRRQVEEAEQKILQGPEPAEERIRMATRRRRTIETGRTNWWKPAGMCGTCTSVWFGIFSAITFSAGCGLPILAAIFIPSLSAVAYKLLERYLP